MPIVIALALAVMALPGLAAAQLSWHNNYAEALAEAKETGKPLFINFRCAP